MDKVGKVSLNIYNTQGRLVKVSENDEPGIGKHKMTWNIGDSTLKQGVSFYTLSVEGEDGLYSKTGKLIAN